MSVVGLSLGLIGLVGPGIKQNATVAQAVTTMDLAGTFMDYASATPADGMTTQSLRPLLEGTTAGRPYTREFISSGLANWRMVVMPHNNSTYKYICCKGICPGAPSTAPSHKGHNMDLLYDTIADPYDMHDLKEAHPSLVTSMRALLPTPYDTLCA